MFIVFFLLVGAFFIISENNIQMNNTENFKSFFSVYTSWLFEIFDNTKELTGYFIRMEWLPEK